MAGNVIEKPIGQIQNLKPYLSVETQKELDEILAYWEKIKAEWERKKKEFWSMHDRHDFKKLFQYKLEHKDEIEWEYQCLNYLKWLERKKFIEEYLYDDMLYTTNNGYLKKFVTEDVKYSYEQWKKWKVVMKECIVLGFSANQIWDEWVKTIAENIDLKDGMELDLSNNGITAKWIMAISQMNLKEWVALDLSENPIWDEWAIAITKIRLKEWMVLNLYGIEIWVEWVKAMAEMELKDWVELYLDNNKIWDEWAKAIAEDIKLKDNTSLYLSQNEIWDEWAKAIAKNMKLQKWVTLSLEWDKIWDAWAEAIIQNMELKEWVELNLKRNQISEKMQDNLRKRNEERIKKWINCKVEV